MTDTSAAARADAAPANDVGGIAADRLRSFIEHIYAEAKGTGF